VLCRKPPDAQRAFARPEHADPGDGGPAAGQPGVPGPLDGDPVAHWGRLLGDHRVGLPAGQALATVGVVMVTDADHIPCLKQSHRHLLAGHDTPPGKVAVPARMPARRPDARTGLPTGSPGLTITKPRFGYPPPGSHRWHAEFTKLAGSYPVAARLTRKHQDHSRAGTLVISHTA
jgi:hypothetical protein